MTTALILQQDHPKAHGLAKKLGLELVISPAYELRWGKALFVGPGVCVPWEMLEYGFHFLERWDAAAPLWRYGVLATNLGSKEERQRTQKICLDVRLMTLESGLLFVKNNPAGQQLLAAWRKECRPGWDQRLAFLRALHLVKPIFCTLPRSWLADEQARAQQNNRTQRSIMVSLPQALTRVEIAPGRFVKCRVGEEEKVKRHYQRLMQRRTGGE